MADGDDYQPRTPERLVEILRAQSQQPRSWPNEAADTIERFRDALVGLVAAVVRDSSDPGKGISGYTSARLSDAQAALRSSKSKLAIERLRDAAHDLAHETNNTPSKPSDEAMRRAQ